MKSKIYQPLSKHKHYLVKAVIDEAYHVYFALGPDLLKSGNESVSCKI
jgi:hypothetical protein